MVVVLVAREGIVAVPALHAVVSGSAEKPVRPAPTVDQIRPDIAVDGVVPAMQTDEVVHRIEADAVGAALTPAEIVVHLHAADQIAQRHAAQVAKRQWRDRPRGAETVVDEDVRPCDVERLDYARLGEIRVDLAPIWRGFLKENEMRRCRPPRAEDLWNVPDGDQPDRRLESQKPAEDAGIGNVVGRLPKRDRGLEDRILEEIDDAASGDDVREFHGFSVPLRQSRRRLRWIQGCDGAGVVAMRQAPRPSCDASRPRHAWRVLSRDRRRSPRRPRPGTLGPVAAGYHPVADPRLPAPESIRGPRAVCAQRTEEPFVSPLRDQAFRSEIRHSPQRGDGSTGLSQVVLVQRGAAVRSAC